MYPQPIASAAAVRTLRDVCCGADWNDGVVESGSV